MLLLQICTVSEDSSRVKTKRKQNKKKIKRESSVQSLVWEDPLEKGMATQSSILAWRIPWTEEPWGPYSIVSQRAGHNWSDLACTHAKSESKACLQVVFLNVTSGSARQREWNRERKPVGRRAIKLTKDNWCLITPRPYEIPHEYDRLYPGVQGRNIYQSTCPSVAKTDLMHALHFQYKYSGMQSQSLRFPCCKIREASRGKKKKKWEKNLA